MSIINEKASSPSIEMDSGVVPTSANKTYNVLFEGDEATAVADFKAFLPSAYQGMSLQSSNLEQVEGTTSWVGTATYSIDGEKKENQVLAGGGTIERFEISSKTIRKLESMGTTRWQKDFTDLPVQPDGRKNKNQNDTPDYKNLINVNPDGAVQGVDIGVSQLIITVTKQYDDTAVDNAFKLQLLKAMNSVNSVTYRGWKPGEVYLQGISNTDAGNEKTNITYRFVIEQNRVDTIPIPPGTPDNTLTVGDITKINKNGHEYLWVSYREERDTVSKAVIKVPKFIYVEKMYDDYDFNNALLGIG